MGSLLKEALYVDLEVLEEESLIHSIWSTLIIRCLNGLRVWMDLLGKVMVFTHWVL